jgi:hypothetical protein
MAIVHEMQIETAFSSPAISRQDLFDEVSGHFTADFISLDLVQVASLVIKDTTT